jgi:hypothetical protein
MLYQVKVFEFVFYAINYLADVIKKNLIAKVYTRDWVLDFFNKLPIIRFLRRNSRFYFENTNVCCRSTFPQPLPPQSAGFAFDEPAKVGAFARACTVNGCVARHFEKRA